VLFTLLAAAVIAGSDTLVVRAPEEAGMSSTRLQELDRVLHAGVRAGAFPGAALVVVRRGVVVWESGVGRLGWSADEPRVSTSRSMYDLASITKVMATAVAVLLLHQDGRIDLDAPVSRYLPEFTGGGRGSITVRQLLTHQGGLPSGISLAGATTQAEREQRLLRTPVTGHTAGRPIYSDAGPMILAVLVQRVAAEPLDAFVQRRVYGPMGLRHTSFRPPSSRHALVAPTGRSTVRERAVRGEVHDGAARLLGGVAGHAGLFASARDVAAFAQMVLNGGRYRGAQILEESAAAAFTSGAAERRALGWSICHGGGSCGHRLSASAFGHTGFTGTSVWVDPEKELVVVLLTNQVHRPPAAAADPIAVLADVRADIADLAALAITDGIGPLPPLPTSLRVDRAAGWYTPVGP
jgi:serine-type D-Ala-D-Ala carboxypeptidase